MKYTISTFILLALFISCSHQTKNGVSRKYATSEIVYTCIHSERGENIEIVDGNDGIEITYSYKNGLIQKWKSAESFPDKEDTVYFATGDSNNMNNLYLKLNPKKKSNNEYKLKGALKNLNWVFSDPIEDKYISFEDFICTGA